MNSVEIITDHLQESGAWISPDLRVTEETAAEILGITDRTLRRWRANGTSPSFVLVGRVTYRIEDLVEFIESRRFA